MQVDLDACLDEALRLFAGDVVDEHRDAVDLPLAHQA
jgi:hypothetical protein